VLVKAVVLGLLLRLLLSDRGLLVVVIEVFKGLLRFLLVLGLELVVLLK